MRTTNSIKTIITTAIVMMVFINPIQASTNSYAGTVLGVNKCSDPCYIEFTVEMDFLHYTSYGTDYNEDTKVGETNSGSVEKLKSACMINGKLTNQQTFANALRSGMWGDFYESTWLNAYTHPNFDWGEVVSHDPANNDFTIKVHYAFRSFHTGTNPPEEFTFSYDNSTSFHLEDSLSTASEVLDTEGNWVQIHNGRPQMVELRSSEANYDHDELRPHEVGQRGYANDLTSPAIIRGYDNDKVYVRRLYRGIWENISFSLSNFDLYFLDGKACNDAGTVFKPGRRCVLGHYRSGEAPHMIYVRSKVHNAVKGKVQLIKNDSVVVIEHLSWNGVPNEETTEVTIKNDAMIWLNGLDTNSTAIQAGYEITFYPERGRTIKGFKKHPAEGPAGELPPLPQVSITKPSQDTVLSWPNQVELKADVNYSSSIKTVSFYKNNTLIGKDSTIPYTLKQENLNEGEHYFKAMAIADDGATGGSDPLKVTVDMPKRVVLAKADTLKGKDPLPVNFTGTAIDFGCNAGGEFKEKDGTLILEAENYTRKLQNDDEVNWYINSDKSGYSGDGYITTPETDFNASWSTNLLENQLKGCEANYDIYIQKSGNYNVWIRRYANDGSYNSAWMGLNGDNWGWNFDNGKDTAAWIWVKGGSFDVDTGLHTFQIRRRENKYRIDKILMTTETNTPSGKGGNESDNFTAGCKWEWNFGDGNTDTGQNVSHTYNSKGTFNAVLTVSTETPGEIKSDSITITVDNITGFKDNFQNQTMKVYPTLTNNNIYIENAKGKQAKIMHVSGTHVINKKINSHKTSVDLTNQTSGMYIIRIENKTFKVIKK